eukprot:317999-Chlamydomonas_euryale.AAC.2
MPTRPKHQDRTGLVLSDVGFLHDDRLMTLSWPVFHRLFEQARVLRDACARTGARGLRIEGIPGTARLEALS